MTLDIRGAVLGRHVGHDSCCCSAVSEPADGLPKLVSARGRCGIRLVPESGREGFFQKKRCH